MAYGGADGSVRGIGGWLAFFLFGFAVISPIRMVVSLYSALYRDRAVAEYLGDRWPLYEAVNWSAVIVSLGVIGLVTWRLVSLFNPTTVRIAIAGIFAVALGIPLLTMVVSTFVTHIDLAFQLRESGLELTKSAAYAVVWCAYFLVSQRVHNTYHSAPEDDGVADAFA